MTDIAIFKKNKIELTEYDFAKDVHNRVLMAEFSLLDVEVLEEILYSSLRIPLSILEKNLNLSREKLLSILSKLSQTELFEVVGDHVVVNKEMRKYYELQIVKFEEDFKPGMDYLQGLLRKVPIHVLPIWYSFSRTSDNIFESILEKYLISPQIFQRYLMELHFSDPIQKEIMNDLYSSPTYEITAMDVMEKYQLSQESFEQHMLFLEFSFVCCVQFKKKENQFVEVIVPFSEWQEYLLFTQKTKLIPLNQENIKRKKSSDFGVIEELSVLLEEAAKSPLTTNHLLAVRKKCPEFDRNDFEAYAHKLDQLHLASFNNGKLIPTNESIEWLKMDLSDRALFIYRYPFNQFSETDLPEDLHQQRTIREAEKSIFRVIDAGWVDLEEFLKGIFIPLNETQTIILKRQGRTWKYHLPEYTKEEKYFFRILIEKHLFESGIVALGEKDGRKCFCVTPLGQDLFSNE